MFFSGQQLVLKYAITTLVLLAGGIMSLYAYPYPMLWFGAYICLACMTLMGVAWGNVTVLRQLKEVKPVNTQVDQVKLAMPYVWIAHHFEREGKPVQATMLLVAPATSDTKMAYGQTFTKLTETLEKGVTLPIAIHPKDPQQHYIAALRPQLEKDSVILIRRLIILCSVVGFFTLMGFVNL